MNMRTSSALVRNASMCALSVALAAPAFGALTGVTCRIVDYGADMGDGYYRGQSGTSQTNVQFDVDGDGIASDDSIGFWAFSLTNPLNPPGLEYDVEAPSARFYGGMTIMYSNRTGAAFTEGMLNKNHELRDDCNFMCAPATPLPAWRAYGLWVWLKEDFMNGGNSNPVSFDASSLIVPHISRYYSAVTDGRWVVRDGAQFYISKMTFEQYSTNIGRSVGTHTSYILNPTQTDWAPYNPSEPCWIVFDAATATFQPHTFSDVTAVGFYVGRHRLFSTALELKWHSFECYATVSRPEAPSYHQRMASVPAGGGVPAFYLGATEVPYSLWKRVWKQFTSNQRPMDLRAPGYTFDKDGDMGSMDFASLRHNAQEPATDMTWYDAVAWCNAFSELEGLKPCYYTDAGLTNILRKVKEREYITLFGQTPIVYVDWSANGFRLPVPAEWAAAFLAGQTGQTGQTSQTCVVGSTPTNALGFSEMLGNVWEYTWDTGTNFFDPALHTNHLVLGGSFVQSNAPAFAHNAWGEIPWEGHYAIGLRVARSTGSAPPLQAPAPGVPAWTFAKGQRLAPTNALPVISFTNQMVYLRGTNIYTLRISETDTYVEVNNHAYNRSDEARVTVSPFYLSRNEITFAQWNTVLQWAQNQGNRYDFDYDGDLGSMDYRTDEFDHGPDEPVTGIGWYDAALWCNALSEMEGRTPCYYLDEARTQVYRRAHPWRVATVSSTSGYATDTCRTTNLYVHWDANGYRLPTHAEWQIAYRAGNETVAGAASYPWGSNPALGTNSSWLAANAGGTTHPVGQKGTNALGIADLAGNVSEWSWDWPGVEYYRPHNPKGDAVDARLGQLPLFGITYNGGNFGGSARVFEAYYQDHQSVARSFLGFRVARCDAGVHPANDVFITNIVLNFNTADYDPLQGRIFRGNLKRTGVLDTLPFIQPFTNVTGAKWVFNTGSNVMASPVVVDGVVYVGSDNGRVYALDAQAGTARWTFVTSPLKPVRSGACVANGVVYITADNVLFAIDAAAGTQRWKYTRGSAYALDNSPALAYGTVFCGFEKWSGTAAISGIDALSGKEVWRFRAMDYPNNGPQGPAIDETTLYTAGDDNVNFAADLHSELLKYRGGGHHCYACIAVDTANVYYIAQATLRAVDKNTSLTKWMFSGIVSGDQNPRSSPAIAGGTVFIGMQDTWFYAINANNGQLLWKYKTGGEIWSSPIVAGNAVFVGSQDGWVYAFDVNGSGTSVTPIWRYQTGGPIKSSPWIENGVVFIGSDDGNVYAINSPVPEPAMAATLACLATLTLFRSQAGK